MCRSTEEQRRQQIAAASMDRRLIKHFHRCQINGRLWLTLTVYWSLTEASFHGADSAAWNESALDAAVDCSGDPAAAYNSGLKGLQASGFCATSGKCPAACAEDKTRD